MTYKEKSKILECADYICLKDSCAEPFFNEERGRESPFLFHRNSVSKQNGAPFVSYPQQLDVESSQLNTRKKKKENWTFKDLRSDKYLNYAIHWQYYEIEHQPEKASMFPRLACPVLTFTHAYISPALLSLAEKETAWGLNHPPLPLIRTPHFTPLLQTLSFLAQKLIQVVPLFSDSKTAL